MAEREPEEGEQRGKRFPVGAVVAAGVATVLGAFAISKTRQRKLLNAHEGALEGLAKEMGATFTPARPDTPEGPDFPSLSGESRGRRFRIDTEVGGKTLHYDLFTRAVAEHKAVVPGFLVIREETVLTRMADRLGLPDIQVGEPAFDDRFEVTSDQPDTAKLLQPEIRDALLAASFESCVIRPGEVIVRQNGPVTDPEVMRQVLKLAVDIAEWLETLG